MKALIIANGLHPPATLIRSLTRKADLIVCADGGANYARKFGIRPHIILGDLDSITPITARKFRDIPIILLNNQDSTDLEKAILYCLSSNAKTIAITGGLGTRIDHATGTLGCLKKYAHRCSITLYDTVGSLVPINKFIRLRVKPGQQISLIPLTRCTGVTTKNLRYPLDNESLELGVREGISNETTSTILKVSVKTGTLLLYKFYE
jgi:thiamine pyrophosphokinase